MSHEVKFKIRDEELILQTGKIARQANGSVFARYGGSAVLATVCASDRVIERAGFIPLSVEYNEKYYAAGKIPGGFFKREGRPREKEILVSRLIDRPIRPLFSKKFGREIQVIPTTVATDQINPPDILGMIASYAAVFISDIPFEGPVAAVRVAAVDDALVINPTFDQIDQAALDIIVAGTDMGITMVEGGAREVSEDLMIRAIEEAHGTIKELCAIQHELRRAVGKEKVALPEEEPELEVADELRKAIYPGMEEACFVEGKLKRSAAIKTVKEKALADFEDRIPEDQAYLAGKVFEEVETEIVRKSILQRGVRTDGRKPDEIRPISCEIDVLPRTHGSALFTRGETQSLGITTLGTVYDEQIIDNIDPEDAKKKFMLHYNFPPFSVGETGRLYTGRREIGHGHLAERAISKVLPAREVFPYTIRVVSEILESNGSSSMATVCSGTMSLLNAGVPLSKSVAGIAMGLVKEDDRYVVLSDILGEEDHLGDMDFKVAGTTEGITAFQMDIKIEGVDSGILGAALEQARNGRMHILSIMSETIAEPRGSISDYAPKIVYMTVDKEKIGAIIGPQGKTIKGISEKTGATVSVDDDGTVTIYAKQKDKAEEAQGMIEGLVQEPEVGRVYNGTVKRIMDFGAFVEFLPGKEGLCHISQLSRGHVDSVTDVLEEGQEIPVKLTEIDRLGRINLSYIEAVDPDGGPQPRPSRPQRDGGERGHDRSSSRHDRSSRGGRPDSRSRDGRRDNRRR